MNTHINTTNFDPDEKLLDFVNSKVSKLDKFCEGIIRTEVTLNFEKTKKKGTKNKEAKILLEIPGSNLFAEKEAETFEEAIDLAVEALRRQVQKHKEKTRS